MRRSSKLFLSASIILLISTLISVIRIRFFDADKKYLSNDHKQFQYQYSEVIPITGAVGPESFAFDPQGEGPYTGVSDGRIIKWQGKQRRWIDFAVTSPAEARDGCEGSHDHDLTEHMCGRPLGLRFNERTGDLYIADAYMGLVVVGPDGGLATRVATQAQGIPFGFTNALDIHPTTGVVYFTDSSSLYQRRNHISVIVSGDKTGRLMKYDPESKEVTVVLDNLSFPNGVALSQNGDFILVADTANCRIFKFWLQTSKLQVLAELPGFPDNIKRIHGKGDEFWVGIHSRRGKLVRRVLVSFPWLGNAMVRLLPFSITKLHSYVVANFLRGAGFGLGVKLSSQGDVLEMLEENKWKFISEVEERNGSLWIGSVKMPFAAIQIL
ncbi:protein STRICTOSIDINE SYNTHASE-LIKE 2 [Cornus florida]|uniref:protein STRICTOSIDINE SYNTHASE-LIKE 2 n=1 Tax=Cornus florida TaxID=4283 RepID=UPI00289F40FC|nr:protein STRICTOSIDINE SYNTHASE-LIKE 2 [Cornus florida]